MAELAKIGKNQTKSATISQYAKSQEPFVLCIDLIEGPINAECQLSYRCLIQLIGVK